MYTAMNAQYDSTTQQIANLRYQLNISYQQYLTATKQVSNLQATIEQITAALNSLGAVNHASL